MKRTLLTVCLLAWAGSASSAPPLKPWDIGVGPIVAYKPGVTAKIWIAKTRALDAAYRFGNFLVYADHLWHDWGFLPNPDLGRLAAYYGAGLQVQHEDNKKNSHGIRGVVGLSYITPKGFLEIFAEVTPVFKLERFSDDEYSGGLGVRLYFSHLK